MSLYGTVRDLCLTIESGGPGTPVAAVAAGVRLRLEGPLRVALAGRTNAGKSTLLNALVGERLALTDASECTRLVTSYTASGAGYAVRGYWPSGPLALPFERRDDALHISVPQGEAPLRLEVAAPNKALQGLVFIDTPGLGGWDQPAAAATGSFFARGTYEEDEHPADALIYLFRHAHRTDVSFLEGLDPEGEWTAANVIGLLSRADEIGAGRPDAMTSAGTVARRYETEGRLRGLVSHVLPIAGLLAETATTLTEREYNWLRAVAADGGPQQDRMLIAASFFLTSDASSLTQEARSRLLARLGMFGLRVSVAAIAAGEAETSSQLAALLISLSGIGELRTLLRTKVGPRAQTLAAIAALRNLRRAAAAGNSSALRAIASQIEAIESGAHEISEIRTLQAVAAGQVRLDKPSIDALVRLLSGGELEQRLDIQEGSDVTQLRATIADQVEGWRSRGDHPGADRVTREACEAAARTCEGLFAAV